MLFGADLEKDKSAAVALKWLKEATPDQVPPVEWEEGTCRWIFRHEAYLRWEASGYSGPLWIYGIPGEYFFLANGQVSAQINPFHLVCRLWQVGHCQLSCSRSKDSARFHPHVVG